MQRTRLPNRRVSETFSVECAGFAYTATISRFQDARVAEIFLTNHKADSAADIGARDSAVTCSIALQCGADLETIRKAFSRDPRSNAKGPLGAARDLIVGNDR